MANLLYLSLGRRDEVEDLTQEVFLRVHEALPRLKPQHSVFSWIYRIAVNLSVDEARRRKVRRVLSLEFLVDEGRAPSDLADRSPDPERLASDAERKRIILDALQRLPSDQRTIVLLREYEQLSYEEIAEVLQLSIPATKTRLFRGRQHLKKLLTPILGNDL